jgi:hypothetical protein
VGNAQKKILGKMFSGGDLIPEMAGHGEYCGGGWGFFKKSFTLQPYTNNFIN